MELEEIIDKCKSGDRQAQALLYKRYSPQMLRICYRFVRDKQIAQDLMHDGFILILTSIGSLQQHDKLESWMSRIITNLSLRYINQTRLIPMIPITELSEDQEPVEEELLSDAVPLETLLNMVEKLPEGYRNVFKLSVLEGLSHKEIAAILSIAPHSSSSQFHRAKEHLKKMIVQYQLQLLLLLLLLIPAGFLLFRKDTPEISVSPTTAYIYKPTQDRMNVKEDIPVAEPKKHNEKQQTIAKERIVLSQDSGVPHSDEAVTNSPDTLPTEKETVIKRQVPIIEKKKRMYHPNKRSEWALSFGIDGGKESTQTLPGFFRTPNYGDISSSPIPAYTDNWNEYYQYLQKYGHTMKDQREVKSLMEIAQKNNGKIEERKRHYMPFTIGIFLHKSLDKHWGIETGVKYTRLTSDFETGINLFINERQKLHYIGIPIRGIYTIRKYKQVSIYSSLGVTMEIPIKATLKTDYIIDNKTDYSKNKTLNAPLQWSINGGVGLQYRLTPSTGLFIEPNIHYYFNDGSQLKTIWKEHPFSFSLPIGIRFSY